MPVPRVAIIGGGISGLSAAYYLSKTGVPSTIVERRARLGGVVETQSIDGCLVEGGPDSFIAVKPWALELIGELGLSGEVIGSNDDRRITYVVRRGRLVALPDGMMLMAPTRLWPVALTPLLSWPTKIRMGLEYFRRPASCPERSVAAMIEDHYGAEAVEYLAEPLLAGVYGGDPGMLSATAVLPRFVEMESRHGSLTRGALAARRQSSAGGPLFQTLKGGLGGLVNALEKRLSRDAGVAHHQVETIERAGDSGYRLRLNGDWMSADHVVLACPAHEAARILQGLDRELSALLDAIPYTSSMTVALGYDRASFRHPLNGFGFLVPRSERRSLTACTWVNTKFDHRARADRVLLRCFLGGAGGEKVLSESDEAVVTQVRQELRDLMGIDTQPLFSRIARWPRSMAQYTVGHAARVAGIRERLGRHPGLDLAGNAYHGIGVPDCIRSGRDAAERIVTAR